MEKYQMAFEAYLSAKGFLLSADGLLKAGQKDFKKLFSSYMYPMTVNVSFACELFIKSLLTICGIKYPRGRDGHKLQDNYALLPGDVQTNIENLYKQSEQNESIADLLNTYNNAFPDWRYAFEHKNDDDNSLTVAWTAFFCFAHALQEECGNKIESCPLFSDFAAKGGE